MRLIAMAAATIFSAGVAGGADAQPATPPTAAETDPARLGLMQGHPPPRDKQVRWDDASMWRFPGTRWAFSHFHELVPSATIRSAGPVAPLPRALRSDLDAVPYTALDGRALTWGEAFDANFTDGIIVLHKGQVVYERTGGAYAPDGAHIAFSVTKSFVGTLVLLLAHEGRLDLARPADSYVPELAGSALGNATLAQIMAMRTDMQFSEDYVPAQTGLSDVTRMGIAMASVPRQPDYTGPDGSHAFVASIAPAGPHGGNFVYRTPNTQALAWVLERVSGQSLARLIQDRIWAPMGMAHDAQLQIDRHGTGFGGGGLVANLEDMARFGEMIRLGGRWQGRQVLPAAVVQAIRTPGDPAAFAHTQYPGMPGGSYANQWWHRASGQVMAMGIHGQAIYIDPAAELVIARFGSHPTASNRGINPTTVPAYDAIAAALNR
jgi:hypothetical protein